MSAESSGAWRGSVWTPEEDQIILEVVSREGPKWTRVLQRLPGRTIPSIRNRWQRMENGRKMRESGIESKNRCHACGLPRRGHVCLAKLGSGSPRPSVTAAQGASSSLSRLSADAEAAQVHPAQLAAAQQMSSLEARRVASAGPQSRPYVPARQPATRAAGGGTSSVTLGGLHALAAVSAQQLDVLSPPSPPPSAPPSVSTASTAQGEALHGDSAEPPPPLALPPPLPPLIPPASHATRKRGRDEDSAAAALTDLNPTR